MKIRYKCHCSQEREIEVTDRVKDTDIGVWMEWVVTPCLAYDHQMRSPLCNSSKTEYIKIPLEDESSQVGVPNTRN